MKKIILFIILLSASLCAQAYKSPYGLYSGLFLGRTVSASSEALGKSFFNFESNAFSFKANPAMVPEGLSAEAGYSYSSPWINFDGFKDSYYNYMGVKASLGSIGSFGFSRYYLKESSSKKGEPPYYIRTGIDADMFAYSLAYSREISNGLYLGISANYMRENFFEIYYDNASLGFGAVKIIELKSGEYFSHSLGAGLSFENLIEIYQGSKKPAPAVFVDLDPRFDNGINPFLLKTPDIILPQRMNASVSYSGKAGVLSAKLQMEYRDVLNSEFYTEISEALEAGVYNSLFLRIGNYSYNKTTKEFHNQFTYGFGLKLGENIFGGAFPAALSFDYANLVFEDYYKSPFENEIKDRYYIYSFNLAYSFN